MALRLDFITLCVLLQVALTNAQSTQGDQIYTIAVAIAITFASVVVICCIAAFLSSYLHRNHRRAKSQRQLAEVVRRTSVQNQKACSASSSMGLKPPSPGGGNSVDEQSSAETVETPDSAQSTENVVTDDFTIVMASEPPAEVHKVESLSTSEVNPLEQEKNGTVDPMAIDPPPEDAEHVNPVKAGKDAFEE